MVRRQAGCWLLLALAVLIKPAWAQQLSTDPALRNLVIWQAVPDPAGWLWLATDRGGYRYDGQRLVPLRELVQQGPVLPAGSMRAVLRDAGGHLWWGGAAGLWAFDPGKGRLRPVPLPDYPAKRLGVTALGWYRGRLWVGRDADPFSVFSLVPGQPRQPARAELRHPVGWVTGFAPDSLGRWRVLGLGRALAQTPTGRWQVQRLTALYHGQLLRPGHAPTWLPPGARLVVPGTGGQWQLRATGLYRVVQGRPAEQTDTWTWSSNEMARVLRVVQLDSTWFWSAGEQVFSLSLRGLRGGQPPVVRRRVAPLLFGREMELVPLPDGRALLGFRFDAPGAVRVAPAELAAEPLPTRPAQPISTRALGRLPDGCRFVSSYEGLWVQPADSAAAPLRRLATTLQAGVWFATLPLPGKRLLIANELGHFDVWDQGRQRPLPWVGPHPPLGETNGLCLLRDRAGRVWGGSVAGLFMIDTERGTVRRYREADAGYRLHQCRIEALVEGPPDVLWVATSQGLYHLTVSTGQLQRYGPNEPAPRRLPTADVRSLLLTHPDSLWLGTFDQGLLLLHPRRGLQRQLGPAQGLPSESVAFLTRLPTDPLALWLGTYRGLVRYVPRTGRLQHLTAADGLAAEECNRQSVGYDAATGELLVGGVGGASRVRAAQVARAPGQTRPQLLLAALAQHSANTGLTHTRYPAPGQLPALTMAPGDAFLDVQVALADYTPDAQPRYAFRLVPAGQDSARWLGLGRRGTLHLQQVAPGDYSLQLRGETADGQPATRHITLPLTVEQPWQRRPATWAVGTLLLAAAVGGGVYGWQRLRAGRVRAEQQLRARLAADLHDEVGNLLTRVTLRAELAREIPEPAFLDELLHESRAAAATVRDLIWTVDAAADTAGALSDRLQDLLTQSATAAGRPANFTRSPEPFPAAATLRPDVRQHVYLIGREALTNALKHAPAGADLSLTLTVTSVELVLDVQQGGPAPVAAPTSRAGQGLRNLHTRAHQLGGTLTAGPDAAAGAGWRVRLRVPRPLQ
ncbi:hypothetical protein N008_17475 [Hymenobacter sp. APR13]|nr:hypothetical protein N008_17475 [Hymenobacter sp. APR13]